MVRTEVRGVGVPAPGGTYSAGVQIGDLLQVSGQGPLDPDTGQLVGQTCTEQVRATLDNVAAVLAAAGACFDDVLMLRVYLTNPADFDEMDRTLAEYVSAPYPARTTVFVGLGEGMRVEIDALARVTT